MGTERTRRRTNPVRVAVYGSSGKVGSLLVPALGGRGWSVQREDPAGADVAVDFTTPEGVVRNVSQCLALAVPVVIDTTGWPPEELDLPAREAAVPVFFAPNFAIGGIVMMKLSDLQRQRSRTLTSSRCTTRPSEMHRRGQRSQPRLSWGPIPRFRRSGCPG